MHNLKQQNPDWIVNDQIKYDLQRLSNEPTVENIEHWRKIRTKLKEIITEHTESAIVTSGSSSLLIPLLLGKPIDLDSFIGAEARYVVVESHMILMFLSSRLNYALYKDALSIPDYQQGEDFKEIRIILNNVFGQVEDLLFIDDHINGGRKAKAVLKQLRSTNSYKNIDYVTLTSNTNLEIDSVRSLCEEDDFTQYIIALGHLLKYVISKDTPQDQRQMLIDQIHSQIEKLNQDLAS